MMRMLKIYPTYHSDVGQREQVGQQEGVVLQNISLSVFSKVRTNVLSPSFALEFRGGFVFFQGLLKLNYAGFLPSGTET